MISAIAMLALAMDQGARRPPVPVPPPPPILYVPAPPAPPPPPPPRRWPTGKYEPARARANLGRLVTSDDYPASALRAREEGVTAFRLEVRPDGRVGRCVITESSGSAALDSATCRMMTSRARFQPARDSKGEPVWDRVSARIVWRIVNDFDRPWAPALYAQEMRATAAGAVSCWQGWDAGPLKEEQCNAVDAVRMAARARAAGKAIEQRIVTKLTPEGMAEPADRPDPGDRFLAADAELRIGSDGSILECRLLRNEYLGAERKRGTPPSPCVEWDIGSTLYLPAAEGEAVRTVKVKVGGFVRESAKPAA